MKRVLLCLLLAMARLSFAQTVTDLSDPGANGLVFRNSLGGTRIAASADVIGLFSGACSVSTFMRGDGSCATAVSSVFGRTGAVTATLGDYNLALINGGIAPSSQTYDFATNADVVNVVTKTAGTSTTDAASTAFVGTAVANANRVVASTDLTNQSANVGTTTVYAVPSDKAGIYEVTIVTVITQAATTSSTLPAGQTFWTDQDTSAANGVQTHGASTANVLGGTASATSYISAKASTNIQFNNTGYASSGATPLKYSMRVRVKYLG